MNTVTIPVGNGKVIVEKGVLKEVSKGKYIVLTAISETGPCQDGMCQLIRDVSVSFEEPFDDDRFLLFAGEGVFVAMEEPVYKAINKGRETVRLSMGLFGKASVKGFVFTA